jgi:hypothetical protein
MPTKTCDVSGRTGVCARCGGVATMTFTNRYSTSILELDQLHYDEHADALKRAEWEQTEDRPVLVQYQRRKRRQ